jgi:photosystem II stability/assembly factor-like uncharacterized protein
VASKGVIVNGTVNVYALNGDGSRGTLLATVVTNDEGEYQADIGTYTGPVLLEASGDYTDEATGTKMTVTGDSPLRAAIADAAGNRTVAVTPLTELAVRSAGKSALTPASITTANAMISGIFCFDVITNKPLPANVGALQTARQPDKDYTLALAAISQMASQESLPVVLAELSTDVARNSSLARTATTFVAALHAYLDHNSEIREAIAAAGGTNLDQLAPQPETFGVSYGAFRIDPSNPAVMYRYEIQSDSSTTLFKSSDRGATWHKTGLRTLSGDLGTSLIIDPVTPTTLYAGIGTSLLKSVDGGFTWNKVLSTNLVPQDIAIDPSNPSNLYVVADTLYKSTDGGASWSKISVGNGSIPGSSLVINSIVIDPATPTTLYVAGYGMNTGRGAVYKSTDGGNTWLPIYGSRSSVENVHRAATADHIDDLRIWDVYSVVFDPAAPTTLYVASFSGGIFKSTDAGGHWFPANDGFAGRALKIVMDPANALTLYAFGPNGVFKSVDGGKNWNLTGLNRSVTSLSIDPGSPETLYATSNGAVLKSTNGGQVWKREFTEMKMWVDPRILSPQA